MKKFLILILLVAMQSKAMEQDSSCGRAEGPGIENKEKPDETGRDLRGIDWPQIVKELQDIVGEDEMVQFTVEHWDTLERLRLYYCDDESASEREVKTIVDTFISKQVQPKFSQIFELSKKITCDLVEKKEHKSKIGLAFDEQRNQIEQDILQKMSASMMVSLKIGNRVNSLAYQKLLKAEAGKK